MEYSSFALNHGHGDGLPIEFLKLSLVGRVQGEKWMVGKFEVPELAEGPYEKVHYYDIKIGEVDDYEYLGASIKATETDTKEMTMTFEFTIPMARGDLLTRTGVNQYVVDEILPLRLLPYTPQEFRASCRSEGPLAILKCFNGLFSCLKQFSAIGLEVKEETWELLLKALSSLANCLADLLDTDLSSGTKQQYRNAVKMLCYLTCQFVEVYEVEDTKAASVATAGKARKKLVKSGDGLPDWEVQREQAIRAMLQLLTLNLSRLWEPPVVEEDFVNLVTNCCYKLLENPAVTRDKTMRDVITQLLGVAVKRYNHALGCSLKIIQLLQHFEHLAVPLASTVETFVNDFGIKTTISEIMREIGRMDPKDLACDSSGTRAYAQFLVELSEKVPSVMLPSISVLLCHLDGESYMMRNSVLSVVGEILMRVLSKENLDQHQRATRDQFLDLLEDHIHDVNAFSRSRVLQIWHKVVEEKAVPFMRQQHLLELVIGRLEDKSSQVRKHAIQVVTELLRSNPFAAKLPLEELKSSYEEEQEKLKQMMPEEEQAPSGLPGREKEEETWREMLDGLQQAVADVQQETTDSPPDEGVLEEEETAESVVERLQKLLDEQKYREAVRLLILAQDAWPQHPVFTPPTNESQEPEQEDPTTTGETEGEENQGVQLLDVLHNIYVYGSSVMTVANLEAALQPSQQTADCQNGAVNEVSKQQVLVQYLKDSMNFATQVQKAVPVICQLLGSKSITDVMEAINFFVTSFEFGVSNAMVGVRCMLALIWSKEQSIKEAVVAAYKRLYLNPDGGQQRAKVLAVVNNLTALTYGATMGDLASLEELVSEFVRSDELNAKVIQMLWERFAMKVPNTTPAESKGALMLIGMAASAQVDIVGSNIDVLVKEGLGPRAEEDLLLARDACSVLLKLATTKRKGAQMEESFRLPQDHKVFQRLVHILHTGLTKLDVSNYVPMAEQAVNVIYRLAEHSDLICGQILKKMIHVVMSYGQTSQSEAGGDQTTDGHPLSCPSAILARVVAVAGQVALQQLVHLDVSVLGELKRRQNLQEENKNKPRASVSSSVRKAAKKAGEEMTIEEEMGLLGACADDAEAEYIRKVTETEIVTGSSLLALLRPLLVGICSNQVKYPDPELRAAATLALVKFMLVSSEFCETHLQLLFTVLEKSPHAVIRANTIIGLGDLTFRFPNLIEPWTPNLYARLRDPSPQVRKNTLMVLTHLILNDMVKVKGQISEMATCIVDEDERISNTAKLFFHELAKKGNAVYNIMPDVISRLSDPDVGVEEDHFRTIMRYLFSFIQKDRQCESLVEKLCHRFRATRLERQWRDLSFCLSMLSYSGKSIRKLQENFACFSDKLGEEEVYKCFVIIIKSAKKLAKPESKAMLEELEQRIEQAHLKVVDDNEATDKASKASAAVRALGKGKTPGRRGRNTKGKTPATNRKRTTGRSQMGAGGDADDSDEDDFQVAVGKKVKPKLSFSSDEDDGVNGSEAEKKTEGPTKTESNNENIDPNVEDDSFQLPQRKKRHQSVNKNAPAIEKRTPRRSRRKEAASLS